MKRSRPRGGMLKACVFADRTRTPRITCEQSNVSQAPAAEMVSHVLEFAPKAARPKQR
jgi:hypothetical protein